MQSQVTIRLSKFVTKTVVFFGEDSDEQISISPPTYDKTLAAEGYDSYIRGKLEIPDQDLVFVQEDENSPILLKELKIQMKNFSASLTNIVYSNHYDGKYHAALIKALADKRKQ